MLKTVILISLVSLFTTGQELCDMNLGGGICLFGGETVIMPISTADNLVGHWTFDDDSCLDYSGSGNHCKTPGPAAPSRTSKGHSLNILEEQYIEIPHSSSFESKIFSMTFWLYMHKDPSDTGLRWCPIIHKGTDDEENLIYQRSPAIYYDREDKFLKVYVSTDEMIQYPQGEYVISNARIPYYKWHHIAVVRTQSRIRLYVNGIIDAINSTAGWTETNKNPFYIGNTPWTTGSCPISMYVDDLKFYDNRELTEEEVEAEAFGALGAIEPYFIRLSCINCAYEEAVEACPDTHHMCTSIELHSAGYAVARAMGWTDWNSHIWSTASTNTESDSSGLGICCLNLE